MKSGIDARRARRDKEDPTEVDKRIIARDHRPFFFARVLIRLIRFRIQATFLAARASDGLFWTIFNFPISRSPIKHLKSRSAVLTASTASASSLPPLNS